MADFHQEGIVTTLHALHEIFDREAYLNKLERRLEEYSKHVRITLLLPSLYSEIQNPQVLDPIIYEIQQVRYLCSVVIALAARLKRLSSRRPRSTSEGSMPLRGM